MAGLKTLHDPKRAIAKHLSSQDGAMSYANTAQARADTVGLDATNDRLAESVFGIYDHILKRFPGISMEAASAVAQAMRAKSFEDGGDFSQLPDHEARALVEFVRTTVRELRTVDRADHAALDAYHAQRRKTNSQLELDALVKQYALALSFFKRWKQSGVADVAAMKAALAEIKSKHADVAKATQAQLDYLREQIEMRVIGLGFVEFKTPWSSSKDETVGTVESLTTLLTEILWEENARDIDGELPEVAAVPVMKRKTFKQLGTPTVQADELAGAVKELSQEELLALAEKEYERLVEAGELDAVGDEQPEKAPPIDDSIIGTKLEICWRYWRQPTAEETAKGDKRKRIAVKMWCEGEVAQIANGTTDKESPQSKSPLAKNALRIKWPEDPDRKEKESYTWSMFTADNWCAHTHLGWRFAPTELARRREVADAADPAAKRQK